MLIFSLYLLLLPGIACAGASNCVDEQQNFITKTVNHPSDENDEEDCGSLCTCSCCVHIVTVNFHLPSSLNDKPVFKAEQLSSYYSISLPSNYFGNIWQPPRVG